MAIPEGCNVSFPVSWAAAVPAIGLVANGVKKAIDAVPFSFGSDTSASNAESVKPSDVTQEKGEPASAPSSDLKRLLDQLRQDMRRANLDPNVPIEIAGDGDQTLRVDSDDLEAVEFVQDWFQADPNRQKAFDQVVQQMRSGDVAPELQRVDPRRQTLAVAFTSRDHTWMWEGAN